MAIGSTVSEEKQKIKTCWIKLYLAQNICFFRMNAHDTRSIMNKDNLLSLVDLITRGLQHTAFFTAAWNM